MERLDFENSLRDPLNFWGNKMAEDVQYLLGDEVSRMVHYDQKNPHHVYDLFTHTLHVVEGIPLSAPISLRIAAFFHDIGKPEVAKEKQGRLVFYHHAEMSAKIADSILEDLSYQEEERRVICFYIRYHDVFISWILPSEKKSSHSLPEITEENVHKEMNKIMQENMVFQKTSSEVLWSNLMLLRRADICAQADQVYREGKMIDSKEHKLKKAELIEKYVHKIISTNV